METVKIKSDAHPSGYIIVNADDPRAKQKAPEPVKRRGRPKKDNG